MTVKENHLAGDSTHGEVGSERKRGWWCTTKLQQIFKLNKDMAQKLTERALWSERRLEQYLRAEVRKLGGECLKYSNMTSTGYPDRLCLFAGGRSIWVELKSTGKRPTQLQAHRLQELRAMGHWAVWADSREKIDKILEPFR